MSAFSLKIVTPDGLIFDGQAEKVIVRTTAGDMAVLAKHIDCVAALGKMVNNLPATQETRV